MGDGKTRHRIVGPLVCFVIAGVLVAYLMVSSNLFSASGTKIVCPEDESPYVITPIGTRSENFLWRCLRCGYTWEKTYPEDVYEGWRKAFLEPSFVRDYVLLYSRNILGLTLPDPLLMNWTGGRETPSSYVGSELYVYRAEGAIVTIRYPVVLPEKTVYEIKVENKGSTVWEGELYQRQFVTSILTPPSGGEFRALYDYYGGVGLFDRGIHIIATEIDPSTLWDSAEFDTVDDYWRWLKENETLKASTRDFVSIIISRGDYPTGGYAIRIVSFTSLETRPLDLPPSSPTILRFDANFTNPGEGVAVTEAFTNPLVLVPMGNLPEGKYLVEVHIVLFILTYDESGKPVYTPVLTFAEEVWSKSFEVMAG